MFSLFPPVSIFSSNRNLDDPDDLLSRAEIYSVERLEQHAQQLAGLLQIGSARAGNWSAADAHEAGRELARFHIAIEQAVLEQKAITPASEWLLDNLHVVEENVLSVIEQLPRRICAGLPVLINGDHIGKPRMYAICWSFARHTDDHLDGESFVRFIRAYQSVQPLTMLELWSAPAILRAVLLEHLRRVALRVLRAQSARQSADEFANRLIAVSHAGFGDQVLPDELPKGKLIRAFAVQLIQRLRYQESDFSVLLDKLGQRLISETLSIDDIVQGEHAAQVAANQTVRNIITSMRTISAHDWRLFFESVSLVEDALHTLPVYAGLDFLTRDRYRKIIQQMALKARHSERDIANAIVRKIRLLQSSTEQSEVDERMFDPGYYLLGQGRSELEAELGYIPSLPQQMRRHYVIRAGFYYPLTILIATLLLLSLPLWSLQGHGIATPVLVLLIVAGLFPASDIAVTLVNKVLMRLFWPRHLPRLELTSIDESLRTCVVVPSMLTTDDGVAEDVRQLETHYLANPDGEVYFALLSDWSDAAEERTALDQSLLQKARQDIAELNARYGLSESSHTRFYLLHRRRQWNAVENKWMGWERKRGKLHEFNRLLRNASDTSFLKNENDLPSDVRYVITLDADTRLPIGGVRSLVGVAAHPLNRPRHDPVTNQVVEGYGILQPRITPTLPIPQERTLYRRFFSMRGGVDPYGGAAADVYQDVFGWGSYAGKGLYDVDAFERALAGKVPENSMLSHDLFEGALARCALVNDVELFEDFPSHLEEASARQHRWTRGDWQLLPWLLQLQRVTMSGIDRMKVADNLRRSLMAPAILVLLVTALCLQQASSWPWLMLGIVGLASSSVFQFLLDAMPHRDDLSVRSHWRRAKTVLPDTLAVIFISLSVLVQHAWLMLDAITRTLFRLYVSHRHLLEWITSAQVKRSKRYSIGSFVWRGRIGVSIALVIGVLVLVLNPAQWWLALPFVLLWLFSPVIARWISMPPVDRNLEYLSVDETTELRLIARRTWRFFTTFVTAQDHHLPPDNFQEDPQPVVAHRSSPTNFGLYLLSVVTARDSGWIGLNETMHRLELTMGTLQALPKYQGHFFNWYDTERLALLSPRYISTVDSGNLAAHLYVLAQACSGERKKAVLTSVVIVGLKDTLLLMQVAIQNLGVESRTQTVTVPELQRSTDQFNNLLQVEDNATLTYAFWESLTAHAEALFDLAQAMSSELRTPPDEVFRWAGELRDNVRSHGTDFVAVVPWAELEAQDLKQGSNAALWQLVNQHFDPAAPLEALPASYTNVRQAVATYFALQESTQVSAESQGAVSSLRDTLEQTIDQSLFHAIEQTTRWCERLIVLEDAARQMAADMDFRFLLSAERKLFSIGYNVENGQLDDSYYDLLASEARTASLIAIAERQTSPSHWFRLGRRMLPTSQGALLASWSGSMFEYLMPALVMSSPRGSMLDLTCRGVIRRQIEYGRERHVPWGVSESAFNVRDRDFTYQYSPFGVPGLGLKRGLEKDVVITPYATGLAAMYMPKSAVANFKKLASLGALGKYGFYEALDFTLGRRKENQTVAIVRAYMAHHQGMLLVALGNVLNGRIMRRRFHREPILRSADLLLHEHQPQLINASALKLRDDVIPAKVVEPEYGVARHFDTAMTAVPETQLLSNGHYAVMLTAAGSGYSLWNRLAVTRWREDVTRDSWGSYLYLRDTESETFWSATYQPTAVEADSYQVKFSEDRARFSRTDGSLSSTLEVIVSPEDDAELRRLTVTNHGTRTRFIEVTSYMEVLLAPTAADIAHPAFSNLFVETEYLHEVRGLLASRRPRKNDEVRPWAAHVVARSSEHRHAGVEYETDRARFLGRGQGVDHPLSVSDGRPLSNTVGAVLDPVFSLRVRLEIEPGQTSQLTFSTMAADSREAIIGLADKYHDPSTFARISSLVWTHAQVHLHHLKVTLQEAELFQSLAGRILFASRTARVSSHVVRTMRLSQAGLWGQGISGDRPIVLLRMTQQEGLRLFSQLMRAHEYWRVKHLPVDLVVLNEKGASYAQELQGTMESMVRASQALFGEQGSAERGGIYIVRGDLITQDERALLLSAARVVLDGEEGSLTEQLKVRIEADIGTVVPENEPDIAPLPVAAAASAMPPLVHFNGLGGFDQGGREYVIVLGPGQVTPAPWINVIANPTFGFTVSERGTGYTWCLNSRENKLTPWSNDPVSDPAGEAFYLRDEDDGSLWSPTAAPIRVPGATYTTRHGQGYSRFELHCNGIASDLLQFVAWDDPVRICRLRLSNTSGMPRRLSLTAYVEWVLGATRTGNAAFITTEHDEDSGALLARNPWNIEFGQRVAFMDLQGTQTSWTGDRREFVGRNGNLQQPMALRPGVELSNRLGAGHDPCGALQTEIALAAGEQRDVILVLGQGNDTAHTRTLIQRYREMDIDAAFAVSQRNWQEILQSVQVETPDQAMDFMLNGWLLYQTLSCRFWARTAFYQAGGAYGFRDQLQDTQALVLAAPKLAREQILKAASRQFPQGDVQHWWHPPSGRGVRTHISDDLIWLPYCAAHYAKVSGDEAVFDESVAFLEGELLPPDKEDNYFEAKISEETASLYEHCARALDLSLRTGSHGLPLMGGGDWNDGMNRVGHEGKGESIWLAWFLHATLMRLVPIAEARGDHARAVQWQMHAAKLRTAIEEHGWDGAWYRRAYFDDGTPLGSSASSECRIDSIAQSWAVLSEAGEPMRARRAMESVEQYLIRPGDDLILLFTPPFDRTHLDPGYIKGYLPGVRENGGQYTHAAVWCLIAYAMLGDGSRAHDLFNMINPAHRTSTRTGMSAYKVEPYAVAADIYAESPHARRGGWSWYTGAAGWLYRAGTEFILGLRIEDNILHLKPCLPPEWRNAKIHYRYRSSMYHITIKSSLGTDQDVVGIELDGVPQMGLQIAMQDDGGVHAVTVFLGSPLRTS